MRADRLVEALLVLQAREQVTAEELAAELEVSVRTARRDLEGLAMAGIPVYSQPGRGGGWRLIGGARTDLSGLTADEARTLFLVAGPSAATPEVRTALRKLVQALPSPFRADAEAAAGAVVQDPTSWDHTQLPPPAHLELLQQAVIEKEQVRLGYGGRDGKASQRVVHPLGLVVKNQVWYLIAGTEAGQRTFRVSRVRSVEPTGEAAVRPAGFDLAAAWRAIITTLDEQRAPATVHLRTDPETADILGFMFGTRLVKGPSGADGRMDVEIRGQSEEMVARQLSGLGGRFEVIGPESVRRHLAEIGRTLTEHYGQDQGAAPGPGDPAPKGPVAGGPAPANSA
jgi:predicted DNA-binding transcriptional regulator YafY